MNLVDPWGLWFGWDDLITGPADEIFVISAIVGLVSTYLNSTHIKDVVNGLVNHAQAHANKCMLSSPEDPNQKNWRKEIVAALDRARRLVEKRLKGVTKETFLKTIDEIYKSIPWD